MPLFAGIDLGTSSLKVLVVNELGDTIAVANRQYKVNIEKIGYAEQDPKDWCNALEDALFDISKKCNINEIISIGFSGQMHGLVPLDEKGDVIRPAIIWMDQRTKQECLFIQKIARVNDLYQELLNKPAAGMLVCSLLWMKENEKENFDKINKVISPKDYIRYYLTGETLADETDASATLCYSIKDRVWSETLLDLLEFPKKIMPKVIRPYENAGNLKKELADKFKLKQNVYIAAGGGDSAMQLLGNGIIDEYIFTCNIGTASQLATALKKPIVDKNMVLQTWCYVEKDLWYMQSGTLNGGNVLKWLKENILDNSLSYEQMDKLSGLSKVGSQGLICLPYLAGERTPFVNPSARAMFIGFSMKHSKNDMIRAVMEGIIYNLKLSMEIFKEMNIGCKKIISSGGGSRGVTWKQIQADMLNLPVYTTNVSEQACLGAAIMGAYGKGYFSSIKQACEVLIKLNDSPVYPIKENAEYYEENVNLFKKVYETNKDIFPKLQI